MPYQAREQSLYQTGGPNSISRPIDIGGAIDALTGGATGLIHQAYLRRVQDHQIAQQDAQLALSRQREARDAAAQEFSHSMQLRTANEAKRMNDLKLKSEGYHDADIGGLPPTQDLISSAYLGSGGGTIPLPTPRAAGFDYNASLQHQGDVARTQLETQKAEDLGRFNSDLHVNEETRLSPIRIRTAVDTEKALSPVRVGARVSEERALGPVRTQQAVDEARGKLPIEIERDRAKRDAEPLHQDEAYTAMHLPRIADGLQVLEKFTAPSAWQTLAKRNLFGNYTLTPEGQQYNAAADRLALSGAVLMEGPRGATPQRVEMFKKTYLPAPGDDPATTVPAKLQQLREVVRDGITKSGRGYARMDPASRAKIEQFINPPAASPTAEDARGTPAARPLGTPAERRIRAKTATPLSAHVQTVDEMIRAGKSDAEIKAALSGRP